MIVSTKLVAKVAGSKGGGGGAHIHPFSVIYFGRLKLFALEAQSNV